MSPPSKPAPSVTTHDPHRLWDSRPIFSHVASSTGPCRIVATAGQVGADAHRVVPADIDSQIALAFQNLTRCLEAAGAKVTDVFKLVYYIVDYDPANRRHTKHLKAWLKGHRPATTLVPVPALADPEPFFTSSVSLCRTNAVVRRHVFRSDQRLGHHGSRCCY